MKRNRREQIEEEAKKDFALLPEDEALEQSRQRLRGGRFFLPLRQEGSFVVGEWHYRAQVCPGIYYAGEYFATRYWYRG